MGVQGVVRTVVVPSRHALRQAGVALRAEHHRVLQVPKIVKKLLGRGDDVSRLDVCRADAGAAV